MIPTALRILAPGASGQLIAGGGKLLGWSIRETSGAAPAVVQLTDGPAGGQGLLQTFGLLAGQSLSDWQAIHPAPYYDAVNVVVVSGAVEGVVWVGIADPHAELHIPVVITIAGPVIDWLGAAQAPEPTGR